MKRRPSVMGEGRTIVISGAGIGGLTAALALAARGFQVVVCERAERLSEIGAGIQITPNAGRVLAGLGLDKAMAAAAIEPESIDILDGRSGRCVTSVAAARFRARYDFPYRVIHRADLQSLLAAAVARIGVRLELGAVVEAYIPRPTGLLVRIRKTDAREVVPAEAIIAADGVWSSLRQKVAGDAAPTPTGRSAWRALIPTDIARDLVATRTTGLWLGTNAHLVHYPVAQGTAVSIVAIVEEAWDKKGWSAPGDPDRLTAHFARWSSRARALLAAPIAWHKHALLEHDCRRPWVAGRLALLGDAAHAMTPHLAQGAAMAIEDAAVLAAALARTADTEAALNAYVAARQPRVAEVVVAARRTGARFHCGALKGIARNAALRLAGPHFIFAEHDWLFRWQPEL